MLLCRQCNAARRGLWKIGATRGLWEIAGGNQNLDANGDWVLSALYHDSGTEPTLKMYLKTKYGVIPDLGLRNFSSDELREIDEREKDEKKAQRKDEQLQAANNNSDSANAERQRNFETFGLYKTDEEVKTHFFSLP
eukprot:2828337-Rhodomonas_salina.1